MSGVISFLTDFGLEETYVGEMKGRILTADSQARLVDLTHAIPPGDVAAGAFLLSRAWSAFPAGSVHLAVVDPGVGTDRAPLAVEASGHWFVGPDNGLLSMAVETPEHIWRLDAGRVVPGRDPSPTFHGRDLFAPAAVRLLRGEDPGEFATEVTSMTGLEPVFERRGDRLVGEVLWVDHFGNAITAIGEDALAEFGPTLQIRVGSLRLNGLHSTFGDVESLTPLAYVGSGGTLELAVRDGDLSERFGIDRGSRVEIRPLAEG
jgi:S-adenosylmethionine hydrolase